MTRARAIAVAGLLLAASVRVSAWPAETMTAIGRDGRRLLPGTLSRLLGEREEQIQADVARFPPELVRALAQDLSAGALRETTIEALDAQVGRAVQDLRERRVSAGLVRLGALLRITADLSDPVLAAGPEGWPPGLAREYYALFAANLTRMPVVLDDSAALQLSRRDLPGLWRALVERSREQAPLIRGELIREGRVVGHERLDYRSPAWAVASLAYSRAVTATAATWLAAWRDARGDLTRPGRTRTLVPQPAELAADRRSSRPEAP